MTLILELPDGKDAALKAKAQALGVSAEQFVQRMLDRELAEPSGVPSQPFWKVFNDEVHALPGEIFERLPADGASEHDHYLYGSPKRNS